jgi:hypothetical protein
MTCEVPDCGEPIRTATNEAARRSTVFGWQISRRQFVVIAGGSAAAVAVAGGYGIATTDSTRVKRSSWSVRVVRAGRGARLTAAGLPAFHAAPGPSVFTSRPSPAVLSRPAGRSSGHADPHAGTPTDGGGTAVTSYPQPYNLTWGDVVVLEVEVLNTTAVPMLFSPGQLRLKLPDGLTITPEDASRSAEPIAAGSAEMLWVSYLAPSDAESFSVEFTDPQHDAQVTLGMPRLVTAEEHS